MDELSLKATLVAMTEHESRLRALLEQHEPAALTARPSNGDWSAIENVRHAFYAEQHHIGRYVPGGLGLSPMGLPQGHTAPRAFAKVTPDLAAIFEAWERVHAEACARLDLSQPGLELQLPRLFRHQQAHARLAIRALSEATGLAIRMAQVRKG